MTGMEVTLVIIGVIFLIGSFFIHDRLSSADMRQIANVSEKEINMMLEKQMKEANSAIIDKVDLAVEESYDATRRALEMETKEKLSTISVYSDTVIEAVNKAHNEIMFLYSMLNDKHKELTNLASELSKFSSDMKKREDDMLARVEQAMNGERPAAVRQTVPQKKEPVAAPAPVEEVAVVPEVPVVPEETKQPAEPEEKKKPAKAPAKQKSRTVAKKEAAPAPPKAKTVSARSPEPNEVDQSNEEILRLHRNGMSEVDIAKALGRGLGEVRFVIGLYRGDVVR